MDQKKTQEKKKRATKKEKTSAKDGPKSSRNLGLGISPQMISTKSQTVQQSSQQLHVVDKETGGATGASNLPYLGGDNFLLTQVSVSDASTSGRQPVFEAGSFSGIGLQPQKPAVTMAPDISADIFGQGQSSMSTGQGWNWPYFYPVSPVQEDYMPQDIPQSVVQHPPTQGVSTQSSQAHTTPPTTQTVQKLLEAAAKQWEPGGEPKRQMLKRLGLPSSTEPPLLEPKVVHQYPMHGLARHVDSSPLDQSVVASGFEGKHQEVAPNVQLAQVNKEETGLTPKSLASEGNIQARSNPRGREKIPNIQLQRLTTYIKADGTSSIPQRQEGKQGHQMGGQGQTKIKVSTGQVQMTSLRRTPSPAQSIGDRKSPAQTFAIKDEKGQVVTMTLHEALKRQNINVFMTDASGGQVAGHQSQLQGQGQAIQMSELASRLASNVGPGRETQAQVQAASGHPQFHRESSITYPSSQMLSTMQSAGHLQNEILRQALLKGVSSSTLGSTTGSPITIRAEGVHDIGLTLKEDASSRKPGRVIPSSKQIVVTQSGITSSPTMLQQVLKGQGIATSQPQHIRYLASSTSSGSNPKMSTTVESSKGKDPTPSSQQDMNDAEARQLQTLLQSTITSQGQHSVFSQLQQQLQSVQQEQFQQMLQQSASLQQQTVPPASMATSQTVIFPTNTSLPGYSSTNTCRTQQSPSPSHTKVPSPHAQTMVHHYGSQSAASGKSSVDSKTLASIGTPGNIRQSVINLLPVHVTTNQVFSSIQQQQQQQYGGQAEAQNVIAHAEATMCKDGTLLPWQQSDSKQSNPFTFPTTVPTSMIQPKIPQFAQRQHTMEFKPVDVTPEKRLSEMDDMPQLLPVSPYGVDTKPIKKEICTPEEEEELVPLKNPFNMRLQNLANLPTTSIYRTTQRAHSMAVQKAKSGSIIGTAKTLDLLRLNLQKSMDKEIHAVIQKYVEKFFKPGIENIKENNGPDSVSEEHINAVCRQILEEAKKMYMSDSERQSITPTRDVSDNVSESGSTGSRRLVVRKRKYSDTDSDKGAAKPKKKGRPGWSSGRSTPSKLKSGDLNRREGPKWDPERLNTSSQFIMGARANKALGFGATRGRIYIKHPELFKYTGDQEDKVWLCQNHHMPATGGKAYMLLLEDISELLDDEEYKDVPGTLPHELLGFTIPDWMLEKAKVQMNAGRTDSGRKINRSRSTTPSELPSIAVQNEDSFYSSHDMPFASFTSPKEEDSKDAQPPSPADTEIDFMDPSETSQALGEMSPFNMTGGFGDGTSPSASDLDTLDDDQPMTAPFVMQ